MNTYYLSNKNDPNLLLFGTEENINFNKLI